MQKYGIIFHTFQWLMVLCCMVIISIGDNYSKAFGCLEDEKIGLLKLEEYFINNNRSVISLTAWGDEQIEDCCRWEGVTCSDDVFSKRIANLSLFISDLDNTDEWFMDATLFQPFEELQNLTFRDFSLPFKELQNLTIGYYPSMLRGFKGSLRLKKLQVLDLSINNMSYVPLTRQLPSLKFLDLSVNNLSHGFQELTNLRRIEFLNLGLNRIEGQIHSSIWSLTSLKKLWLSWNRINGSLPEALCSLTYLEELDLSHNSFEGVLPTCLSGLTSLRVLDLSGNKFSRSIPSNLFFGLISLQYVSLSHNLFDGLFSFTSLENNSKIEVFKLQNDNPMLQVETENVKWKPQLKIFALSNCIVNEPNGRIIPSFLLTQYDLRVVDLSNNGMNGEFPNWLLTNNSRLEGLTLRNNSFNGPLQLGSYNNAHIYWFDISMNRVTGEIPIFIGSILPKLIYLDMSTNAIKGSIPSSIENMRELIRLDLSNNQIHGEIPADLFYGCEKLGFLKLSNNSLTTFPPMKSPRLLLTSLIVLDISYNSFTGRFPDLITELSSLRNLDLSKNHFEGKLPAAFCNLKFLQNLDLSLNSFTDTLPPCTHLPSLSYLHLQGNNFLGPLPTFLSKSYSLALLDVSNNKFSGLFPAWISSFRSLTFLLLSGNIFHGPIPSQLCDMENLNIIDLSANNFIGSIPPCLFHIPIGTSKALDLMFDIEAISKVLKFSPTFSYESKLLSHNNIEGENGLLIYGHAQGIVEKLSSSFKPYFDVNENVQFITKSMSGSYNFKSGTDIGHVITGINLSHNKLIGPIPVDIDNLENVLSLNLSYNNLNGSIPYTISRLQILESLDLSHNMLSGKIPSEMLKLTSLEVFSVAYNNLSGPTPTRSNQFGTFDADSYEGNPLLCGPPLVKICHAKPSVEEQEENDSSFKTRFLWSFIGSFGVSCIGAFVFFYLGTNVPQMFLRWIGIEGRASRRTTVELPWKFINR